MKRCHKLKTMKTKNKNTRYTLVLKFMQDGNWHTLRQISKHCGYPEASVSAQLREFRNTWGKPVRTAYLNKITTQGKEFKNLKKVEVTRNRIYIYKMRRKPRQ